jgi:hypothetical protein
MPRRADTPAAAAGQVPGWEASGGIVLDVVTWPDEAASWLRQAIRFAALGTEPAIELVGARNLSGLAGATPDGGTWTVCNGRIQTISPTSRS